MSKLCLPLEKLIFFIYFQIERNCNIKIHNWTLNFNPLHENFKMPSVPKVCEGGFNKIITTFTNSYEGWRYKKLNFILNDIESFLFQSNSKNMKIIYNTLAMTQPGNKFSYQELALKAGFSKSYSRFVGTCMAKNAYPLMYPCHRIIRKNGDLGAYSLPGGLALKQFLLEVEAGIR